MALWQSFPRFEASYESFDANRPLPRAKAPAEASFRGGADLNGVIGVVQASRCVQVNAAPGAGKTVVFPAELSRVTGRLVVHVVPYDPLAMATYEYARKKNADVRYALATTVDFQWPGEGVVLVSAAVLVAKWLEKGETSMPSCYLLHDESHESGAASAALRLMGPSALGVMSYVAMTATEGPSGHRKIEAAGELIEQFYVPDSFEEPWSVEEDGAPWAAADVVGNIVIYEDDGARAAELVQAYNYAGLSAHRLTANMPPREFRKILKYLYDKTSPWVYALVADSSFRSGYTLPVATYIDSGKVKRLIAGEDGHPEQVTRSIYEFERLQTMARGARIPGLRSVYWRPMEELQQVMCDLGPADVDALALICRFLGYRPPTYVAGAKMLSGRVPIDLAAALSGPTPLASLGGAALEDGNARRVANSVVDLVEPLTSSPSQLREASQDEKAVHVFSEDVKGKLVQGVREHLDLHEALDVLQIMAEEPDNGDLVLGLYYFPRGVITTDSSCAMFQEGEASVRRLLCADESGTLYRTWNPHTRAVAVNIMLHAYNTDLVYVRAVTSALAEVKNRADTMTRAAMVRDWAKRCTERLAYLGERLESGLRIVAMLVKGFCGIVSDENAFDAEEEVFKQHTLNGLRVNTEGVMDATADLKQRVRAWASVAAEAAVLTSQASVAKRNRDKAGRLENVPNVVRWVSGYPGLSFSLQKGFKNSNRGMPALPENRKGGYPPGGRSVVLH